MLRRYFTSIPVSTEVGDRLVSRVYRHPSQLSLLLSAGWEMSTGQRAVKLCDWKVKAGMAHSTCARDIRVGGR